jgi:phospholipase C
VPQSILIHDVWQDAPLHYRHFAQFLSDAQNGALPNYSFIEPRYFPDPILREIPNDLHPPHNVLFGEKLIAQVYNAVRSSPCWKKTLLIITFDEHGGCFDHVPPPPAPSPEAGTAVNNPYGFTFNRYGVRVPAVIVSPYIPAGSKIRAVPQGVPPAGGPLPFDHTSIIATVRALFGLGGPLTARDAAAPTLLAALSLALPINDGPRRIDAVTPEASTRDATQRALAPPNGMQTSLARMAASLPPRTPGLDAHMPGPMAERKHDTTATAAVEATSKIAAFLNI